jgi:hypothetical protein
MQDRYLRLIAHCLVLVVVMLGIIAAGLWLRFDQIDSKAMAQNKAEDPLGRFRQQQIEQMDTTIRKLTDLERGFHDGSFVIQTIEAKGASKTVRREEPKE